MLFSSRKIAVEKVFVRIFALAVMLIPALPVYADDIQSPEFNVPNEITTKSGYQRIDWGDNIKELDMVYELQRSRDENFEEVETLYEGKDRATFVSGLPNGTYYFRVRAKSSGDVSAWSEVLALNVDHHSLVKALVLAALGCVVFLFTVYIIVHGVRQEEQQNELNG